MNNKRPVVLCQQHWSRAAFNWLHMRKHKGKKGNFYMIWLFFCNDQPAFWQGGVRNTYHISSQKNSIFWWMLRAELCTSKIATETSLECVTRWEDSVLFSLSSLSRDSMGADGFQRQLFHNRVWEKKCNFPKRKVVNSPTFQTRSRP